MWTYQTFHGTPQMRILEAVDCYRQREHLPAGARLLVRVPPAEATLPPPADTLRLEADATLRPGYYRVGPEATADV